VALSHCCCRTTVQCQQNQFVATSTWWQISTERRVCRWSTVHCQIASGNDNRNRTVFSSRRKMEREGAFRTCCGRAFQARAAATGNDRSPRVQRHVSLPFRSLNSHGTTIGQSCQPNQTLTFMVWRRYRCGTDFKTKMNEWEEMN